MGVPLDVMAAIAKAMAKGGVKHIHPDDLNAIIRVMSPLFEPGYEASLKDREP